MKARFVSILIIFCLFIKSGAWAQGVYFPPTTGSAWDTVSPASLGWCLPELDSLSALAERRHSKALIILKDGKIAYERYYNGHGRDSAWYWASAGKTLAAFLMGIARQDGRLVLENKVSDFLGVGWTTCTRAQEDSIKVIHQITMTTGLDYTVPDLDCTDPACLQYRTAPGTQWYYHNAPYLLTHKVLENAVQQSINIYTFTKLSQTGIRGLWFDDTYYSTARVMARFGLLLHSKGTWNGTSILSDTAYLRRMTSPSQTLNPSYGYLTWLNGQSAFRLPGSPVQFPGALLPNAPPDLYAALGKNDQKIYVVPSRGLVIVRMGDDAGAGGLAPTVFDKELWDYLNRVFCTTGVSSSLKEDWTVSPQPAGQWLEVGGLSGGADVKLVSMDGRIARQEKVPSSGMLRMNRRGLPAGLYILRVFDTRTGNKQSRKVLFE